MLFSKKEDESKLPDLPTPKRPFDMNPTINPPEEAESGSLPAFPDSPGANRFSQAAIKDAVGGKARENFGSYPQQRPKMMEMEEWTPGTRYNEHPELEEVDEEEEEEEPQQQMIAPPPAPVRRVVMKEVQAPAEVFVRIDKFHAARKALSEISEELENIDELVKKIRETKMREEQELNAWEKDIMNIKSRLQGVTENIFEKVE